MGREAGLHKGIGIIDNAIGLKFSITYTKYDRALHFEMLLFKLTIWVIYQRKEKELK